MSNSKEGVAREETLPEEVAQALVGDVDPRRLESFAFAERILPIFRLVRSLFSQNALDTCLKLMVLYELTRLGGRFSLDRIRIACRFLDGDRVEAIVRSLREGGWLELRESDHTSTLSPAGIHLLSVLHAADFGNLNPANALSRAAQNAAFGATLDGADPAQVEYLLTQLLVLLEDQVEQARGVMQQGRPHRLIDWNRREHRRQLETIQQVLNVLQERLDASSRAFAHVVRLHEAMQEIVRLHTGIHVRLREWNLDRLYTADAGYSVPEMLEAVLGADDGAMARAARDGLVREFLVPPSLSVSEIAARVHSVRRRLAPEDDFYTYARPPEPVMGDWNPAEINAAVALQRHLTDLFRDRTPDDEPLEIEVWRRETGFSATAWEVALLSQLHGGEATIDMEDGRRLAAEIRTPTPVGVPQEALLEWMETGGGLRRLPDGWYARVRLRVLEERADG